MTIFKNGGAIRAPLLLAVAAALGACGAQEASPSPTPTAPPAEATASPTPPAPTEAAPLDDWQAVRSIQIAPAGVGLDLDGDGEPDNGVYAAMSVAQDIFTEALYADLCDGAHTTSAASLCELDPDNACCHSPKSDILAAGVLAIHTLLTVENLNAFLADTYALDDLPYAARLRASGAPELSFYRGTSPGEGLWQAHESLGGLRGDVQLGGAASRFDQGTLDVVVIVLNQADPSGTPLTFTLWDAKAELVYDPAGITQALLDGGITVDDMVDVVEAFFEAVVDTDGAIPVDPSPTEALTEALLPFADVFCHGGRACYSVPVNFKTTPVTLVGD